MAATATWFRLIPLTALLLAGCASPGPDGAAPDAPVPEGMAAEPAPTVIQQTADLSWTVSGVACAHSTSAEDAVYALFLPELDGVTYASTAVDPASIGMPWALTVPVTPTLLGFEVAFWKGKVGGEELLLKTVLPPFSTAATAMGQVPDGAEFVSVLACSAEPGTAQYVADLARPLQAMLVP